MLVNAANHPGPAMWQGLMMCALPLVVWGAFYKDGAYMRWATGAYVALGVVLFVVLV